jgi:hypothetical protein
MSKPRQRLSLSSFSGLSTTEAEVSTTTEELTESLPLATTVSEPAKEQPLASVPTVVTSNVTASLDRPKKKTIQTELPQEQLQWLSETAAMVRTNSTTPVQPRDRCYPQHLIAVAIDLLRASPLEWSKVQSIEGLRDRLNL